MWTMRSTENVQLHSASLLNVLLHDVVSGWTEYRIIESLCVYTTSVLRWVGFLEQNRGRGAQTGNLLWTLDSTTGPCGAALPVPPPPLRPFECTHPLLNGALIPLEIMSCLPKNTHRYTCKSHHMQAWQTYWITFVIRACANVSWTVTMQHCFGPFFYLFWSKKVAPTEGNYILTPQSLWHWRTN